MNFKIIPQILSKSQKQKLTNPRLRRLREIMLNGFCRKQDPQSRSPAIMYTTLSTIASSQTTTLLRREANYLIKMSNAQKPYKLSKKPSFYRGNTVFFLSFDKPSFKLNLFINSILSKMVSSYLSSIIWGNPTTPGTTA